jgi:hypothetical protein
VTQVVGLVQFDYCSSQLAIGDARTETK